MGLPEAFAPDDLCGFAERVLGVFGVPDPDARTVAECLVAANLRGVDTHGIQLLPAYVRRLAAGVANARPALRVLAEGPAFAVVDGGNGLGPVVGAFAMDKALALARRAGVAAVTARGSNHFGAAAWYAERAAAQGMIGIALSNGTPALAPWGGRRPFFGANPVAVVVPARQEAPVVFDMATSVSSRARIREAAARGEAIPEGWAVDKHGRSTTSAADALEGAVLPVGGAKGYGLALVLELLAGALAGAGFSPENRDLHGDLSGPQGLGHFFLVLEPARFRPDGSFGARVDWVIRKLHDSEPAHDVARVRVPGDLDTERREERLASGVVLPADIVAQLDAIGRDTGVGLRRRQA